MGGMRRRGGSSSGGSAARGVRWNLAELYDSPSDPRLREHLAEAERLATELERRFRGRILTGEVSDEELAEALALYEHALERGTRPGFFASLLFAADTANAEARALETSTREAWATIRDHTLFVDIELQRMPEERLRAALGSARLAPWHHYLETCVQRRPHTLSEPEERILNRKELSSSAAFEQLFDELSGSLRFEIELDGEPRLLSDSEMMSLLHRPERDVRRRALEGYLETWKRHELVLTSIFNNLLLDHRIESDLRRFPSLEAERHLENDVEPRVVEAMMAAVESHYGDVQRYLRLKASLLGLADPSVSDVYAPVATESAPIPFEEARGLVLDSFARFSGRFADLARRFFDESWIDAEIRPSKRSGAFCASQSPNHHPYVLTSYAGTARDVSTLAHELGHGVHAMLANRHTLLSYDAPLVLAETASVFAEMLLTDHLLAAAGSRDTRVRILCDALDEIYGTIFRQNAMTRFEQSAHAARRAAPLEAADLGRLWIDEQRKLFGDAVSIPEIYRWGWIYIPHFVHSPFYCYAYSFGDLLVLALFERYRAEGERFVPGYLELLAGGGSESPARLLDRLGIDLSDPSFWETGLGAVGRLIDQLEREIAR